MYIPGSIATQLYCTSKASVNLFESGTPMQEKFGFCMLSLAFNVIALCSWLANLAMKVVCSPCMVLIVPFTLLALVNNPRLQVSQSSRKFRNRNTVYFITILALLVDSN